MIKCNLPPLGVNKTCAITGHRDLPDNFDRRKLKEKLEEIISDGYEIFLVGMAVGFDLECFSVLNELKKEGNHIKICAVIPCSDQDKYFSEENKALYNKCLTDSDYIAQEERTYFKNCMLLRDDYLIKNCSLLFAYHDGRTSGGTYYTINKALKNNVKVINFDPTHSEP